MWPRAIEIMLAIWLTLSPWIFRHDPDDRALWLSDLVCAAVIVLISSLSFADRLRRLHLANLGVAAWLIGFGYFAGGHPAAPGYQNEIFIGLILVLFAIIPNEATKPPLDWRRHYEARDRSGQR